MFLTLATIPVSNNATIITKEVIDAVQVIANDFILVRYVSAAALTWLLYDHALTFEAERDWIWHNNLTLTKALFLINRYSIPLVILVEIIQNSGRVVISDRYCVSWLFFEAIWQNFSALIAQFLIGLRMCAIWGSRPWTRGVLYGGCLLCAAASLTSITIGLAGISSSYKFSPDFGACFSTQPLGQWLWAAFFLPIMAFDLLIFLLTIWNAVLGRTEHLRTSSLTFMMWRDGVVYFILIFASELACIIVSAVWGFEKTSIIKFMVWAIQNVIVGHMTLNLVEAVRQPEADMGIVSLPVSTFSRSTSYRTGPSLSTRHTVGGRQSVSDARPSMGRRSHSATRTVHSTKSNRSNRSKKEKDPATPYLTTPAPTRSSFDFDSNPGSPTTFNPQELPAIPSSPSSGMRGRALGYLPGHLPISSPSSRGRTLVKEHRRNGSRGSQRSQTSRSRLRKEPDVPVSARDETFWDNLSKKKDWTLNLEAPPDNSDDAGAGPRHIHPYPYVYPWRSLDNEIGIGTRIGTGIGIGWRGERNESQERNVKSAQSALSGPSFTSVSVSSSWRPPPTPNHPYATFSTTTTADETYDLDLILGPDPELTRAIASMSAGIGAAAAVPFPEEEIGAEGTVIGLVGLGTGRSRLLSVVDRTLLSSTSTSLLTEEDLAALRVGRSISMTDKHAFSRSAEEARRKVVANEANAANASNTSKFQSQPRTQIQRDPLLNSVVASSDPNEDSKSNPHALTTPTPPSNSLELHGHVPMTPITPHFPSSASSSTPQTPRKRSASTSSKRRPPIPKFGEDMGTPENAQTSGRDDDKKGKGKGKAREGEGDGEDEGEGESLAKQKRIDQLVVALSPPPTQTSLPLSPLSPFSSLPILDELNDRVQEHSGSQAHHGRSKPAPGFI